MTVWLAGCGRGLIVEAELDYVSDPTVALDGERKLDKDGACLWRRGLTVEAGLSGGLALGAEL